MESNEETVRKLLRSTYVDDIITGADSEDTAFDIFTQAKDMFHRGGFNLGKFLTNSRGLQQRIDCAEDVQHVEPDIPKLNYSDETYAKVMLGAPVNSESGEHKVLGVPWNPNRDSLLFDMSELAQLAKNLQPTKSNLVSLIGKFYDPLGFLAPVTISCFRSFVKPSSIGTTSYQKN